jgi:hypothetical protein
MPTVVLPATRQKLGKYVAQDWQRRLRPSANEMAVDRHVPENLRFGYPVDAFA